MKEVNNEVKESSGGATGVDKRQASCAKGNPNPADVDDLTQCGGEVG